jgi:uncharacterized protein YgfB (UPF0149 family)
MKALKGKKSWTILTALVLILGLGASQAWAWGSATHTYIDDRLNRQGLGQKNLGEMYGGVAPDLFNYLFAPYQPYLYGQTHDDFLKVWEAAGPGRSSVKRALAYGFVSHNDLWGADVTAHHNGLTFGQGQGYVIAKAQAMKPYLIATLARLGIVLPDAVALDLSHNFVEYGVDVLVKKLDAQVGAKMAYAALKRNPSLPALLVQAHGDDVAAALGIKSKDAAKLILTAEQSFRKTKIYEGQALMQDDAAAITLLAEELADFAQAYLAGFGVTLPPGVGREQIVVLAENFIGLAMAMCQGDFAQELTATIAFVNEQLDTHGIAYGGQ